MAGMSTALCSAYTPGGGSGWTWPLSILRRATSRCVGLGEVRSRCASTIAPSAAVISRALVTSNGNTYVVKISCARPVMLFVPFAAVCGAALPMAAWPMPTTSSTTRPTPARPAHSRCP